MSQVHWVVPVLLYIAVAHIVLRWAVKKIVGLHSRTKRLCLQYCFCAVFAVSFAVIMGHLHFTLMTLVILGIGFMNGFACYAYWKAIDISLSRAALFTFLDDLIAMGLSWVILHEGKFLTPIGGAGVILCLLFAVLSALHAYKKKEILAFFGYTLFYSILWGVATFFERYSAFHELQVGQFLSSWYVGAFVASLCILYFYKDPDASQKKEGVLRVADVLCMFGVALGTVICLGLAYWAYSLVPQIIVQPVFLVSEALVPAVVGWVIFKEHKRFDRWEWFYACMGLLGVGAISFGF